MFPALRNARSHSPSRHVRQKRRTRLTVEQLEAREMPSVYTPAQIRAAYGFNNITFTNNGQTVTANGSGETIAIVDAHSDSHIFNDVNVFDQRWGITPGVSSTSFLTVATPQGSSRENSSWSMEMSLDVEWAHAIAPGAKILLVEAKTGSLTNLLNAVTYAKNQAGVVVVSMSWGTGELAEEGSYDSSVFTSPSGRGVTFVAASGDNGAGTLYPSASPNVLTVGGTTLNLTTSGTIISESGWSGSGGGYSSVEGEPSYQSAAGIPDPSRARGVPDVAYNADPNTGYYVYDSNYYGLGGWWQVGGTSAGAPQWAALVAIADEGRRLAGKVSLDGASQTLPALYQHPADFHDITSGSNGAYSAHTGWDPVTGLGSPIANKVIPDLAAVAGNF
jgi:subtilase family serine protease